MCVKSVYLCMCVCVCECVYVCVYVYVCLCVRMRETERKNVLGYVLRVYISTEFVLLRYFLSMAL